MLCPLLGSRALCNSLPAMFCAFCETSRRAITNSDEITGTAMLCSSYKNRRTTKLEAVPRSNTVQRCHVRVFSAPVSKFSKSAIRTGYNPASSADTERCSELKYENAELVMFNEHGTLRSADCRLLEYLTERDRSDDDLQEYRRCWMTQGSIQKSLL